MPPVKKVKKSISAKKEKKSIKKISPAPKKIKRVKVVPVEVSSLPESIEGNTLTPVISLENSKILEEQEHHLSSEQIIGLVVAAVFFVWMGYDIYMITTHLSSITERVFNFGMHLLIFGFFFYAIYWVLIREK